VVLGDGSNADGAGCDQDGVFGDEGHGGQRQGQGYLAVFCDDVIVQKDWLFGYIVLE